ncbi:MAG: hypothetical protein CVU63_08875 [Deltaproteobacteria bacterium HGW-Deltaproteobacteria-20]|nr:MAG: hypothetical protein CVU63_08875 [Deltaproteobacteria bacterium HGW-Deltaproteobacteria-20]
MIPREVYDETLLQFFEPIRPFLEDPTVSEVMINGPDQIFVERKGKLYKTDAKFDSKESLISVLRNAAQFVGKQIDESRPILEGRLPDGSRIEALIPPVAPDGPFVSIRRFFTETLTVQRLIGFGSLTQDAAEALEAMVVAKLNIVVAGGTGSGKTSMLNALTAYIPEGERVIVIEDSKEVQPQREHVLQLEAQLLDRGVAIELTPEAAAWLGEKGYDDKMGARPLGRVIQEYVKKPLAEELLFGKLVKGGLVRVTVTDGALTLEYPSPSAPRLAKDKTPLLTAE